MDQSILFIDDEVEIREVFARMASRLGYQVSLAGDGTEAIALVRQSHFKVIVTDLRMPGLDGLAVLECVRALSPDSVTMLATGAPELELPHARAQDCSLAGILRKPFNLKQLEGELAKAMALYQSPDEAREPLSHRLLLIEDDPLDARLTLARLSKDVPELSVHVVDRLDKAEAYLESHPVGIILADLTLPDARGLDAVDRLRALCPDSTIVVLSGMQNEKIALAALQRGAQDYLPKDVAAGPALKRSIRYAQERKSCEKQLVDLAYRDPLTNLPNRKLFRDRLVQTLARARRQHSEFAVVYIDLDRFKAVNDGFGHEAGDQVLETTARRLLGIVRDSDTVARLGGDEFAVILENVARCDVAQLGKRMIAAVSEPIALERSGISVSVGASIGAAGYPQHGFTADGLLRGADAAMYLSKKAGRGNFHWARPEESPASEGQSRFEMELCDALTRGDLGVWFQPQMDLNGQTVAFEALLRWHRQDGIEVSPQQVVVALEELKLTSQLTESCLHQVCALLACYPDSPWRVALNLSSGQMGAGLVALVARIAASYGVDPTRLELELGEASLGRDDGDAFSALLALRKLGVRVVLDNFGTGASSLTHLKGLPLDGLKIDSAFLTDCGNLAFARSVVEMARSLGLTTTVEKIEAEVTLRHLVSSGCDRLQGRCLSPPLSSRQVSAWLERSRHPLPAWATQTCRQHGPELMRTAAAQRA